MRRFLAALNLGNSRAKASIRWHSGDFSRFAAVAYAARNPVALRFETTLDATSQVATDGARYARGSRATADAPVMFGLHARLATSPRITQPALGADMGKTGRLRGAQARAGILNELPFTYWPVPAFHCPTNGGNNRYRGNNNEAQT
jgi:hypothetical protein